MDKYLRKEWDIPEVVETDVVIPVVVGKDVEPDARIRTFSFQSLSVTFDLLCNPKKTQSGIVLSHLLFFND